MLHLFCALLASLILVAQTGETRAESWAHQAVAGVVTLMKTHCLPTLGDPEAMAASLKAADARQPDLSRFGLPKREGPDGSYLILWNGMKFVVLVEDDGSCHISTFPPNERLTGTEFEEALKYALDVRCTEILKASAYGFLGGKWPMYLQYCIVEEGDVSEQVTTIFTTMVSRPEEGGNVNAYSCNLNRVARERATEILENPEKISEFGFVGR